MRAETEREREARYFAGYRAIPDDDEDFAAVSAIGIEELRGLDDAGPSPLKP